MNNLQLFLDSLAITKNVGFHIQHHSFAPIPRHRGPYVLGMGQWEHKIPPLNHTDLEKIMDIMNADEMVKTAAYGLNETYIENLLPSRVARLWASVEHVFDTKPTPMLNKNERDLIIKLIKDDEDLNIDKERLMKLNNAISNPNRLPLKGRNERIAENIASLLNVNYDETLRKVKIASSSRGKNVHKLLKDTEMLKDTEKFLQEALYKFIKMKIQQTKM